MKPQVERRYIGQIETPEKENFGQRSHCKSQYFEKIKQILDREQRGHPFSKIGLKVVDGKVYVEYERDNDHLKQVIDEMRVFFAAE